MERPSGDPVQPRRRNKTQASAVNMQSRRGRSCPTRQRTKWSGSSAFAGRSELERQWPYTAAPEGLLLSVDAGLLPGVVRRVLQLQRVPLEQECAELKRQLGHKAREVQELQVDMQRRTDDAAAQCMAHITQRAAQQTAYQQLVNEHMALESQLSQALHEIHELQLQRVALEQRLRCCEHRLDEAGKVEAEEAKAIVAAGVREQKYLAEQAEHAVERMSEHEAFHAVKIQHCATLAASEHEHATACAVWAVRSEDMDKELEHAQAALHSFRATVEEEQSISRMRTETSEAAIWKQTRELEERVVSRQARERVLNSFEWAAERDECRSKVQSAKQDLQESVLRANACELTCAGFCGELQSTRRELTWVCTEVNEVKQQLADTRRAAGRQLADTLFQHARERAALEEQLVQLRDAAPAA